MRDKIEQIIDLYWDDENKCYSRVRETTGGKEKCMFDEVKTCLIESPFTWHVNKEDGVSGFTCDSHFYAFAWVDNEGLDMICILARDY